ncbi:hypothetical protein [Brachybacterium sp. NPDC056505]|jgi:hypothetical protein|uniref:hypothetical protein n=1 Tax=Brachybacterium sp. NPDC056505 TaxID=3345843 RepID=UPI00366A8D5E
MFSTSPSTILKRMAANRRRYAARQARLELKILRAAEQEEARAEALRRLRAQEAAARTIRPAGLADPGTIDREAADGPLTAPEPLPRDREGQVDWIAQRAREGRETGTADRVGLFRDAGVLMSKRTVQRRAAEARAQHPEAFAAHPSVPTP